MHIKSRRTKRAPDVWDSAAFSSIFLASSFFCSQALSTPAHTQVTQIVRLATVCVNRGRGPPIHHLPFTIFEPRINGTRMNRSGGCCGRVPPSLLIHHWLLTIYHSPVASRGRVPRLSKFPAPTTRADWRPDPFFGR